MEEVGQQRLVYMRVFQSMTYREIAEETQSTESAVERNFKRAVRRMRYLVVELGDEQSGGQ